MSASLAIRRLQLLAALGATLLVGACAKDRSPELAGAATPGSARDFILNVGDRVFFETDSSDLTEAATATLNRQSEWLARYPRHQILIEGHADERGTREYNYSLSARRAETVSDYLKARGVGASRLRTVSYGKEHPVAVCNDISCWSQNRRGVTVLEQPNAGP